MKKILYVIVVILDIIISGMIILRKAEYYDIKINQQFFGHSVLIGIIWIGLSIIISLLPYLSQIFIAAGSLMNKQSSVMVFLLPLCFFIANEVFEFVSMLGGAASLDDKWCQIAEDMIRLQVYAIIPIILSVIAWRVNRNAYPKAKKSIAKQSTTEKETE